MFARLKICMIDVDNTCLCLCKCCGLLVSTLVCCRFITVMSEDMTGRLGGVVVRASDLRSLTCDREIASSTPGRCITG